MNNKYFIPGLKSGADDGTSEADAWKSWASFIAGYGPDDHVWCKKTASRSLPGASVTFSTDATKSGPIIFEGYETAIGDGGQLYFDAANNAVTFAGDGIQIRNWDGVWQAGATTTQRLEATGDNFHAINCRFEQQSTNTVNGKFIRAMSFGDNQWINCTIINRHTAGNAQGIECRNSTIVGCVFIGNGRIVRATSTWRPVTITDSIIAGLSASAGWGVQLAGVDSESYLINVARNSIYNVGDGIELSAINELNRDNGTIIQDNIIYDVDVGIDSGESGIPTDIWPIVFKGNAIGGATTARYDSTFDSDLYDYDDITLTTQPWVDPDNMDFRLNDAPGGGRLCKASQVGCSFDDLISNRMVTGPMQQQPTLRRNGTRIRTGTLVTR